MAWKFIHPLPGNLFLGLNILDHFQRFRPLAHGIRCVTGPADLNIGNPGDALPFHIAMAKGAAQIGCLFMMNMIEQDGLVHGGPCKGWKKRKEDALRLNLKPVKSDDTQQENQDDSSRCNDPFLHN